MAVVNRETSNVWRSKSFRMFLTLFIIGGIVWIGGLIYRALIANELFIAGTLDFDPAVLPAQESMLYQLISAASIVVNIAYVITIVSAAFVLHRIPLRFKENGWLLMAAVLIFMFVPAELFTGYLDIKFVFLWEGMRDMISREGLEGFLDVRSELRATLSHRIGALSGLPVMAMFCYVTAVVVMIWQPMRGDRHDSTVSSGGSVPQTGTAASPTVSDVTNELEQ